MLLQRCTLVWLDLCHQHGNADANRSDHRNSRSNKREWNPKRIKTQQTKHCNKKDTRLCQESLPHGTSPMPVTPSFWKHLWLVMLCAETARTPVKTDSIQKNDKYIQNRKVKEYPFRFVDWIMLNPLFTVAKKKKTGLPSNHQRPGSAGRPWNWGCNPAIRSRSGDAKVPLISQIAAATMAVRECLQGFARWIFVCLPRKYRICLNSGPNDMVQKRTVLPKAVAQQQEQVTATGAYIIKLLQFWSTAVEKSSY